MTKAKKSDSMGEASRSQGQEYALAAETDRARSTVARQTKPRALVVLGMHRSGTSAVTRLLSLLGADLPNDLLPPIPENNETGFWESRELVAINDEILTACGSSWDDPLAVPESWCDSGVALTFQERIVETLKREYRQSPLFVLKDPRICRLVPLWRAALREFGAEPYFILVIRNPLEVAASLKARDELLPTRSFLLWLRHLLDAERHTRDCPRSLVSYEAVLRDWQQPAMGISRGLGISWPRYSHNAIVEIEKFLSAGHRHHSFHAEELEVRADIARCVKKAYDLASSVTRPEDLAALSEEFDGIRAEVDVAEQMFGPLLAETRVKLTADEKEIERLAAKSSADEKEIERLAAKSSADEKEIDQLTEELATRIAETERPAAPSEPSVSSGDVETQRSHAEHAPRLVKAIAFYLPQFHPIPENDEAWGRGFTEWSNLTRAEPCFPGHQTLLPSELGFYDLRVPETRANQAALAREHGIHGFCYYYYWFQGRKLLHRPLEEMLASGEPDFPFCICWANENWTRRWDGQDAEILIAQNHSPESDAAFIDDVLPALLDPRYIKQNGEPLLLVYRPDLLADPLQTTQIWRETARRAGLPGLQLCGVWCSDDPRPMGFDALVEFPPHHFPHIWITEQVEGVVDDFEGTVVDYAAGVDAVEPLIDRGFPVYRGVMPGWDNTPRAGNRARIFSGSTPDKYEQWLTKTVLEALERPGREDQFVFINAWNEWAEGAVLEPSHAHGRAYLEATRSVLQASAGHCLGGLPIKKINAELEGLRASVAELSISAERARLQSERALRETRSSIDDSLEQVAAKVQENATSQSVTKTNLAQFQRRILAGGSHPPSLWLSLRYGLAGLILRFPIRLVRGDVRSRLESWRRARRALRSGLFDPDFYAQRYPDVTAANVDPLSHYALTGAAEGRAPNPLFSIDGNPQARAGRPDDKPQPQGPSQPIADADAQAVDDTTAGQDVEITENVFVPEPPLDPKASSTVTWGLNQKQLERQSTATTKLLVVSHDAARAGAQIILRGLLSSFSQIEEIELYVLLRADGELRADFERYAHVLNVQEQVVSGNSEESVVVDAVRAMGEPPIVALCNSVASGAVAKILKGLGLPVVSNVLELPTTIESLGASTIRDTVAASDTVIVASEFVKNALVERYGISSEELRVLYTGVADWHPEAECAADARRTVFENHRLPEDAVLVLGCGSIHHRKGTDLFVQVARQAIHDYGLDRVYFLWVGGDEKGPLFRTWCEHDIAASGLQDRVIFVGNTDSTVDYYLAADVFLLTSREDPFPLVNLEALARGVPVVAFRDAGGAQEALVDDAGVVVPYLDVSEMTRALTRLVEAPRYRDEIRQKALSRAHERYRWDPYVDDLRDVLMGHVISDGASTRDLETREG